MKGSSVTRILLVGAFGQRNPGDEALLEAFLLALHGFEVTVASSDPVLTSSQHGVRAVRSTAAATGRALLDADALVYGGGTIFKALDAATGRPPRALLRNALLLARAARALGRPVAMVGAGAAPLPDRASMVLAGQLARAADLLVLRDDESATILAAAGAPVPLRVGADPVWTLLDEPPQPTARGDDLLVALSTYAVGGARCAADLADVLAVAVRSVPDLGKIRLQPWQTGQRGCDDFDLARLVAARLTDLGSRVVVEVPPPSVRVARDGMRSAGMVLSMRMHGLVAAGAAGSPVVALAHEPKLGALARRLGQEAVPGDATGEQIAAAAQRARAGGGVSPGAVRAEIAAAAATMRLLRMLLTGGEESAGVDGLLLQPAGVLR
jgi:polysaccharide pyruvyl transferase WcaK-like protein